MEEQLITFETAKLAKKKGFKEYTSVGYAVNGSIYLHQGGQESVITGNSYYEGAAYKGSKFLCSAPTQSLLQKWLREQHDVFVSINTVPEFRSNGGEIGDEEYIPVHKYRVIKNRDNFKYFVIEWSDSFESYEEALEKGLQEALRLI